MNSGDTVRVFALWHTNDTNLFEDEPGFSFIAVTVEEDWRSAGITNAG